MSSLREPRGPLPPQVYWRRRMVVGLGLIALIVIFILIVGRPAGDTDPGATDSGTTEPAPTDSVTPVAEGSEPVAGEEPAAPGACTAGQVQVAAVTDANSYAVDALPLLSLTLTNTGSTPCIATVGTDVQEYVITSGDDRIWSSKDCQSGPAPAQVTLEPGTPLSTTPFPWQRVRSSPGGACEGERTAAIGGGATYRMTATIGEFTSEPKVFVLQ
jgi:hypothetical protein